MDWLIGLVEILWSISNTIRTRVEQAFNRRSMLSEILAGSQRRCIQLFERIGLPYDKAKRLLDVREVGSPTDIRLSDPAGFVILVGEPGIGKSLSAERLLQHAVERAQADDEKPIPIWLPPIDIGTKSLESALVSLSGGRSTIRRQGLIAIIDGVDELGDDRALKVVEEAIVVAGSWPKATVVITSRPMSTLDGIPAKVEATALDGEAGRKLVAWVSSRDAGNLRADHWPTALTESVRLPLFAILLGLMIGKTGAYPHVTAELLADLAERFVSKQARLSELETSIIDRLAAQVLNTGQAFIKRGALGSARDIRSIVSSGLALESRGFIRFSVPLLADWFGSEAIGRGSVTWSDMSNRPDRLERWKTALSIFIATRSFDVSRPLLASIAEGCPAFLSRVIESVIRKWGGDIEEPAVDTITLGHQIVSCMLGWTRGIGVIAPYIAPINPSGSLKALAVGYANGMVSATWERPTDPPTEGVLLIDSLDFTDPLVQRRWPNLSMSRPTNQPAWPWKFTLDSLRSGLKRLLDERLLLRDIEAFKPIHIWRTALSISGRGAASHNETPIPIANLQIARLAQAGVTYYDRMTREQIRPDLLAQLVDVLKDRAVANLDCPWPTKDIARTTPWVWDGFSDEQLARRTGAVLSTALNGYRELVTKWFPSMANQLQLSITLPSRLVILLKARDSATERPRFFWYHEPLQREHQVEVDCRVTDELPNFWDPNWRVHAQEVSQLRSEFQGLLELHIVEGFLDITSSDAAISMAVDWLESDLKQVGWY